jgi:predicted enzyme related to lactoylglutathione lyase
MKKFLFILFVFFTLTFQSISVSRAGSIPFGLVDDHLNLVISASDESKTINFYGEVLGLNRISDIELPEKRKMIRYIAGESELKFIIRNKDSSLMESNFNNEIGIRQLTLFIPIERKQEIIDKVLKNNIKLPKFINSKIGSIDISKTLINDFDGNIIELVFLSDELDNYNFNTSEFQLNVTDAKITGSFLRSILGFKYIKNKENQDIFKIGKTLVKLNEVNGSSKKRVGLPGEIEGYSLVQFVVNDVIASRNQILMNGGKIHTEPYKIGDLAIIMFIESPDGILFEFGAALVK